jgi:hypothetical protein
LTDSKLTPSALFQDADLKDKLRIAELCVDIHAPSQFEDIIVADFGSATDATAMRTESLLVGALGIDGFLANVVDELLGVLPVEHPSYDELIKLLGDFSRELARKMRNWKKVCVNKPCWSQNSCSHVCRATVNRKKPVMRVR